MPYGAARINNTYSSDHNQLHFNIKINQSKQKLNNVGGIIGKVIRKRLAHIDLNDKMKNKTATECWNILRGEIDSAIDSFVPMKKQGKRSKKKHRSKEAFRKIIDLNKICGEFINIRERIKIMWFTKRH